jgi:hypothetical protein
MKSLALTGATLAIALLTLLRGHAGAGGHAVRRLRERI